MNQIAKHLACQQGLRGKRSRPLSSINNSVRAKDTVVVTRLGSKGYEGRVRMFSQPEREQKQKVKKIIG